MNSLEQAIQYFDLSRTTENCAHYLFHLPRQNKSYLGLGHHQVIRYQCDGFHIQAEGNTRHLPATAEPVAAMRGLLDPAYPSFWMISPDLYRQTNDPDLPLLLCVQPKLEVQVSDFLDLHEGQMYGPVAPSAGWKSQSDAIFIERLRQGIEILQGYPDGKMIITRPYQKSVGKRDALQLFRYFAGTEPLTACSHFLQIDEHTCSLGCSPENVFEILDERLVFDVVAGTRGISPDPATDAKWLDALKTDPKEQREHLMAYARYKARIESIVEPGTLSVDKRLEILQLGNVRHLHSRLSGKMLTGMDWMQLLISSLPALTSYPADLAALAETPAEPNRYYGGVFGRVGPMEKDASFFLNIRAALIKHEELYTQGGVGVIAESHPEKELLEVKNKLSGLMKAIAAWENTA